MTKLEREVRRREQRRLADLNKNNNHRDHDLVLGGGTAGPGSAGGSVESAQNN